MKKYLSVMLLATLAACGGGGGSAPTYQDATPAATVIPNGTQFPPLHPTETTLTVAPASQVTVTPVQTTPQGTRTTTIPVVTPPVVTPPVVAIPVVTPTTPVVTPPVVTPPVVTTPVVTITVPPITGPTHGAPQVAPGTFVPPTSRALTDLPDKTNIVGNKMVHLVYAVPADRADMRRDLNGELANTTTSWNRWLRSVSGGREFVLDTLQDGVTLDITFVRLTQTDAALGGTSDIYKHDAVQAAVQSALPYVSGKTYAVYYEGTNTTRCADAPNTNALGTNGSNHTVVMYLQGAVTGYLPCLANGFPKTSTAEAGYLEITMIHEISHGEGVVSFNAPNHTLNGHVNTDPSDLMYAGDFQWRPSSLDVNGKNYYQSKGLPAPIVNLYLSTLLTAAP